MKMIMFVLFTFLIGLNSILVKAETPPDSCLKLIWPNDYDPMTNIGAVNPDSVKVDSCESSDTYLELYAKKYFDLKFTRYPFDTVIEPNEVRGVNELSDSIPGLKQQFQQLEQEFGSINFKRYAFADINDSALLESGFVTIYFNDYQNIETIIDSILQKVDSLINITYMMRAKKDLTNIKDNDTFPDFNIYPNPVNKTINLNIPEDLYTQIEIYSSIGVKLMEVKAHNEIDVSQLSTGIYFIKYKSHFKKFIVDR